LNRQKVPAGTEQTTEPTAAAECAIDTARAQLGCISWARLLKRVFDIDKQHCPRCGGGELKFIAGSFAYFGCFRRQQTRPEASAGPF
jgi:Zn finger protein HypA/HybF involved in hydrogenase expression